MKILIKLVVGLFGVLLVSTVALAVFLPIFFDPNDYKEEISAQVEKQTGREFTLKGDISLSVFPWLGMKIGEASLGNAPGFGNEPFAAVKSADVRVSLMPLLQREIQVGAVKLDGLALRLQKNAAGQNNWDDIGPKEERAPEVVAEKKPSEFKVESLEVAALDIKNSSVLWSDAQANSRYELKNFNFATGKLRPGQPFQLDSSFDIVAGKPEMTSTVNLAGEVNANIDKKTYTINGFELKAEVAGKDLPGGKQPVRLTGAVDLDLNNQTLAIQGLVLEAFTLNIKGDAKGSQILDKPMFSGQIKATDINPRAVMKAMGKEEPETADSTVLKKASFESGFKATAERADLQPISIKLDDSSMDGSVSVANYSKPAIGFDLNVDQIDLDRYLAPPSDKPASAAGGQAEEGEVQMDAIRDLNLNGTLKVGKHKVKKLNFENASLSLKAQNGLLVIEPLTANFYQGRINMTGRMDASGAKPAYGISAQTSDIKIEPMLTDMTGKAKINGTGTLNVNVTTAGASGAALRQGLNGTMAFNLRDGAIKGFNLGEKLRKAKAMRDGSKLSSDEPQTTDFAEIIGTLNIVNGVLRNNDLDGKSPAFRVNGDGSASLVNETIDYLAKVFVVKTSKGQGGASLGELEGISIPVRLTGNLYAPEWKIDLGAALKEKLKEETDTKIEAEKEKAKQKLMDKLGLGGEAAQEPAPAAAPAPSSGEAAPAPAESAPAETTEPTPSEPAEEKSTEDRLKEEALRKLLD